MTEIPSVSLIDKQIIHHLYEQKLFVPTCDLLWLRSVLIAMIVIFDFRGFRALPWAFYVQILSLYQNSPQMLNSCLSFNWSYLHLHSTTQTSPVIKEDKIWRRLDNIMNGITKLIDTKYDSALPAHSHSLFLLQFQ